MKITAISGMASLQDLGRFGQRTHGIGINGAMDSWSLKAGNALLGNDENAAAIELTLGGLTLEVQQPITFCLTGAVFEAFLLNKNGNKRRVYHNWRITAQAGEQLQITRAVQGMHGYMCVQGGFVVDEILGSASTNLKAEFGGHDGRLLQVGDKLAVQQSQQTLSEIGIADFEPTLSLPTFDKSITTQFDDSLPIIRVLKNSEVAAFDDESLNNFVSQPYKLLSSSNRMGYRLEGGKQLQLIEPLQMNSHGVDKGMIQVPPQGQPIVLMADTQTTGGYPKIASIIEADVGRFAQLRFGQSCRFVWVTLEHAIHARQAYQRYLSQIWRYANDNQ